MIDYANIRSFYDQHRSERGDDPEFLRGTIEPSRGIVRFRNRAEARHLARVLATSHGQHVLDLGAGTGRWSLYFAERGAHVTAVELAPSLADGARRNAALRGLALDCRVGSILDPPLAAQQRFDVVHIGNVLVYIEDHDLARVRDVVLDHLGPAGLLVLREPVDPQGPSRQHDGTYRALFRRPEAYVELFAGALRPLYQRTTVSHLVPRGGSTQQVVTGLRQARWQRPLVEHLLPLVGYVDYHLLGLEERLRASHLRGLLGDAGVVQHFYVFTRC
ncbi:MAG: class I SAM-dependent methyltransferase [Polyangiales bacterium]